MRRNLSIRAKLIVFISLLLIALAGTGSFAVDMMRALNGHTVDIATNWLRAVRILGEHQEQVQRYQDNVSQFVSATEQQHRTAEKCSDSVAQKMDQPLRACDPPLVSPDERILADEMR
jgi:methyl-accepting chemotaxis protein